jgi:hypothetical protein
VLYLRDVGLSSAVITAMLNHDTTLRTQNPPNENSVPPAPVQETPLPPEEAPAYATTPPSDVNYFYNDLSPYGSWVELNGVGWCWQPRVVLINRGWRPYCDSGHWVYSDCGWYWQSDYSWGWAPFHYGRWQMHDRCGWVWVPDTAWGPAWVTWRTSGDYCGWAPLPPHAVFEAGLGWKFNGVHVGLDYDFKLRPEHFNFVAFKDFTHRDPGHRRLAGTDATRMFSQATVVNNYTVNNRVVVNRGIPVERVSAATHTEIRRVAIRDSAGGVGRTTSTRGVENGTPVVYRPQLRRPANPINLVAQKVDERHPIIQHPAIMPVRYAPTQPFTAPRSPVGSSQTVPGSEIERRSSGARQSVPRTYQQTPQTSPTSPGRSRDDLNPSPRIDSHGGTSLRMSPSPQSSFGERDISRQVPRVYSPKGNERSMESRPMVKSEPRQTTPSTAPATTSPQVRQASRQNPGN